MKIQKLTLFLLLIGALLPISLSAQHQHSTDPNESMDHAHHLAMNMASDFLMNEGPGTAVNPSLHQMMMKMVQKGEWNLMVHGYAFLNAIQQSGPRGGDKIFSTNHLMLIAERPVSPRSSLLFRAMLSFEPATITHRFYPLLFQTGETAFGAPIIDGQHPHDFFMELSVQYAIALNDHSLLHFYAAPVGDPALGPVAYPHRSSAQELPQATLSHHLQDSTHIANDVLTAGFKYRFARIEFSGFHGAEPDEGRWDIDAGAIDSWSTRLTLTPAPNWAAQVSTGDLHHPEALEPGDIQRTTASVSYAREFTERSMDLSLIWGTNHKKDTGTNTYSLTAETLFRFMHANYLSGRFEITDKDELFGTGEETAEVFSIKAFTIGYSRDLAMIQALQIGAGVSATFYAFPAELKPTYGNSPKTFLFFLRVRLGHSH